MFTIWKSCAAIDVKLLFIYSEGTAANPSLVIYNQVIDGYVLEAGSSRQHLPLPPHFPASKFGRVTLGSRDDGATLS